MPHTSKSHIIVITLILIVFAAIAVNGNWGSKFSFSLFASNEAAIALESGVTPLAQPGDLDFTFSGDGIVITAATTSINYANAVAIQTDGKIVAVGFGITDTHNAFTIVRYNPDGSLDSTFNGNGISTTVVGTANAIAIQPDGKIVVVGHDSNGANLDFKVVRFNANGTLDGTFDSDGMVTTPVLSGSDVAYSVAIQTNGKIVVSGRSDSDPVFVTSFAMVRYNADGSLDGTFDVDGIVIVPGPGNAITDSLAIQADGKIVLGHNIYTGSAYILTVLRYNMDGSPDTSFDGDGSVLTTVGTNVEQASVAIQADGKIVVACSSYTSNAAGYDFWVVRYNTDGSTDSTFGTNGLVVTPVGTGSSFDIPKSIAIQTNGKIVVGGKSPNGSNNNFAAVRYNTNGSIDSTWGTGGIVTTDLGGTAESINAIAIQSNGRIVAAGESDAQSPSARRFAVVRYLGDTPPPATDTPTNTPTAAFTSTPTNTPTHTATPTPTSSPAISGIVTYGNALGNPPPPRFVSNVLISGAGSVPVSALTGFPDGTYSLSGFGLGAYTVTPTKTGGANGAISSFDAAKIAQHAAGPPLPQLTVNQLLVADVSGNGIITSFDAAEIAKFAIGPPYEPPGIGQTGIWKFVPVDRSYPAVTSNIAGEDYSALLMGEVSGNWTNTGARPEGSGQMADGADLPHRQSRQNAPGLPHFINQGVEFLGPDRGITVELPSVISPVGKEIIVPLNVEAITNKGVISYQFELRYDPSVIQPVGDAVDVKGTASRRLSVVTNATAPGVLRVVVYGAMPIGENGVLLNLRFAAIGFAGSFSPMSFERIMFNDGEPRVSVTDGWIELVGS